MAAWLWLVILGSAGWGGAALAQDTSSLVVPGVRFSSDPRLIELGLLSLFAAGVTLPVAGVILRVIEGLIDLRGGLHALVVRSRHRAHLLSRFQLRQQVLQEQVDQAALNVSAQRKHLRDINHRLRELRYADPEIVHAVGEERVGHQCFLALVANRYVENAVQAEQEHGVIHRSWARPQLVEAWAPSSSAARAAVEAAFPGIFGFSVVRLFPAVLRAGAVSGLTTGLPTGADGGEPRGAS